MYKTEDLTINDGALALGTAVTFDLPIKSRWCKIVYIKIVQLTAGPLELSFEIYESTAAQADAGTTRSLLYQLILSRDITIPVEGGGHFGESLAGNPIPYEDRDTRDEEKTHMIHCRLLNHNDGTASDFQVVITVADIGENA
jgi:hypothetical protein